MPLRALNTPLSEAAVRAEIIAPLLRLLGYQSNTDNEILYEVSLRHPWISLGRPKPTDPPARGKADYVCRAGRRIAWVLEAKSDAADITAEAIAQAYSYARHHEIRAIYFCLCTASEFRVYATDGTPDEPALLSVDPRDTQQAVEVLRPLLGPAALLRRWADRVADSQPPIGPGLLSFAQVLRGSVVYQHWTPVMPHMDGMTVPVTSGAVQRTENGLLAYWESQAPFAGIQRLLERLGLTRVEACSESTSLSADPASPTVFAVRASVIFPRGETLRDFNKHEDVVLKQDIHCALKVTATGVLVGASFRGPLVLEVEYRSQAEDLEPIARVIGRGTFEFQLK